MPDEEIRAKDLVDTAYAVALVLGSSEFKYRSCCPVSVKRKHAKTKGVDPAVSQQLSEPPMATARWLRVSLLEHVSQSSGLKISG